MLPHFRNLRTYYNRSTTLIGRVRAGIAVLVLGVSAAARAWDDLGQAPVSPRGGIPSKGVLTAERQFESSSYDPGGTLDVAVTLRHTSPASVSSLAVTETLPPGWSFRGVLSVPPPAICPPEGAAGTLGFAWVQLPVEWPVTLRYRAAIPAGTAGLRTFAGSVSFREDGGEVTVPTPASAIDCRRVTVTFAAGPGGRILGDAMQSVPVGGGCSAVTAAARFGYVFTGWDDGFADACRADSALAGDLSVTALFRVARPVPPDGGFLAPVEEAEVAAGRGWWDFSGRYVTAAAGHPLTLNLVHDPRGRLSGNAVLLPAGVEPMVLPLKGTVKGKAGAVTARVSVKGSAPAGAASLSLCLALDPAVRQLAGAMTGTVTVGGASAQAAGPVTLTVPDPMDGTWTLRFTLSEGPRGIAGASVLELANGTRFAYLAKGKPVPPAAAALALSGDPGDPAARGIRIKTAITPLEGGWARLETFSGKGYGQALAWQTGQGQ